MFRTKLSMALAAALLPMAAAIAAPAIVLQDGNVPTAVDTKVSTNNVPVVYNGQTKYYNFVTAYKLNTSGIPVVDAANSRIEVTVAPLPTAGTYVDQVNYAYNLAVGGPDAQGRYTMTLNSTGVAPAASFSFKTGATAGHPQSSMITQCQFTPGPYYGLGNSSYWNITSGYLSVLDVTPTTIQITPYLCGPPGAGLAAQPVILTRAP